MKINALVAHDAAQPLTSGQVSLRALQKQDVKIEILFCGVCHSDLHMARNEWAVSQYPLVPGHEIVDASWRLAMRPPVLSPAILSAWA